MCNAAAWGSFLAPGILLNNLPWTKERGEHAYVRGRSNYKFTMPAPKKTGWWESLAFFHDTLRMSLFSVAIHSQ